MGMFHVCLLVMFSSVLSVRSCTTNGGTRCNIGRKFVGTITTLSKGNVNLPRYVYIVLPPASQRTLYWKKRSSGIARVRSNVPHCPAEFQCPTEGVRLCPERNKTDENESVSTSATTKTHTDTQTSSSKDIMTVATPTKENDQRPTSRTSMIETTTHTSPSTCTDDSSTVPDVVKTFKLETGSRVRGKAFVKVQWQINEGACVMPTNQTLKVVKIANACNDSGLKRESQIFHIQPGHVVKTIEGLDPVTSYKLTLTVMCNNSKTYCKSDSIRTAESVPTKPPEDIKCKEIRDKYLIFKWSEPPCNAKNGNITNYDFIFMKENENRIHNVVRQGKNFAVFNRMRPDERYKFKVRANTQRGYGVYSEFENMIYKGTHGNCTTSEGS